jgi:hypothetical protein
MDYYIGNYLSLQNVSYMRMGLYARVINARPAILRRPSAAVFTRLTEAHCQAGEWKSMFLSTEVAQARRLDCEREPSRLRLDGRRDREKEIKWKQE